MFPPQRGNCPCPSDHTESRGELLEGAIRAADTPSVLGRILLVAALVSVGLDGLAATGLRGLR
jgi:hypothetical protein